ncbi:hypothetical protein [Treponema bryantii]|uniref:hypothetical protein n=1 Tax=Treponema bryantii TaxID=163 RepID=UPI0012DD0248|nr:hypothetical protein [Treponema bryantii]
MATGHWPAIGGKIMDYKYTKQTPVKLREIGKDEKWLQEMIEKDPSILNLGDLAVIERERKQSSGGRIDFLMYNPDDGVRYEVELMLGTVDESHIIRTIEYWDIERKRFPSLEHRAVIVAEQITNRFFNIISLLNQSIPLIAIQLNAFTIESNLCLNFVKVLDINEPGDEELQGTSEIVNREYWEQKVNKKSLQVLDEIVEVLKDTIPDLRITYNKNHIAMGSEGGVNFSWFHPRKGTHIHFDVKIDNDVIKEWSEKLEESGIENMIRSNGTNISAKITSKELSSAKDLISELFNKAYELAK